MSQKQSSSNQVQNVGAKQRTEENSCLRSRQGDEAEVLRPAFHGGLRDEVSGRRADPPPHVGGYLDAIGRRCCTAQILE